MKEFSKGGYDFRRAPRNRSGSWVIFKNGKRSVDQYNGGTIAWMKSAHEPKFSSQTDKVDFED